MTVGTSTGISFSPRDGENVDGLIRQADQAMYAVKKSGKNGFRFAGNAAGE
jgi:GGDEF domain-containing protein